MYKGAGIDERTETAAASPTARVHGVTAGPEASIDAEISIRMERCAHRPHESQAARFTSMRERLGSA